LPVERGQQLGGPAFFPILTDAEGKTRARPQIKIFVAIEPVDVPLGDKIQRLPAGARPT
jgi:hypothetical protein